MISGKGAGSLADLGFEFTVLGFSKLKRAMETENMLIVSCGQCGKTHILAGAPDSDGYARASWACARCGTGQVLQLEVSCDAQGGDLRGILGGLGFAPPSGTE